MNHKGFTLLETMIAVTIMLLFVVGGARFFENTVKSWQTNYTKMEIQQNARIAMDEMAKNLLGASAATVVINAAAVPANSDIMFQVTKDTGTTTHVFYLSNNTLIREFNSIATEVIPHVTELFFAKRNSSTIPPDEDPRCIYIKLVVEKNNQKVTLENYIHLRNE